MDNDVDVVTTVIHLITTLDALRKRTNLIETYPQFVLTLLQYSNFLEMWLEEYQAGQARLAAQAAQRKVVTD